MRRTTSTTTALLAALLLAATALWVGVGAPARADTPAVSATRLRIELTTSADWARVRLEGLTFPATRTLAADDADSVTFAGNAWTVVDRDGDGSRFVVDTVAEELTGRADFRVSVEQALGGTTRADVHDDRRGAAPVLGLVTGDDAGGTTSTVVTATREDVLGTVELALPHADDRRLVLAAYYPWWKRTGNPTSKMAEEPVQPRSAWDLTDVRSHVAQARAAGIDGFAVSWSGADDDGPQLDLVLQASAEQGSVVTPYLETKEAAGLLGKIDATVISRWLDEALARAGSPGFLKAADGVPVVMVFAMEELSPATWQAITAASAADGRPVHLLGDADPATHGATLFGWHRYGASGTGDQLAGLWRSMAHRLRGPHLLDPAAPNHPALATVSPGYDDTRLRGSTNPVIPRGADGARYDETWAAAIAADPDFVLVTSWNEWFEGTSVEPGTVNGDLALRQTGRWAAAWKAAGASPSTTTSAPTTTVVPPPTTTTTTTTVSPPPAPEPRRLCAPLWVLQLCLPLPGATS
ncbi:MAG TPA: glycoside hydrolase family 99-like domain-containing protein [Acidimicrobiales bacterium]|nr:glycoside hydrolase family 99-like domain-containing protein [Acidimicrobiales bacterium]